MAQGALERIVLRDSGYFQYNETDTALLQKTPKR